MDHPIGWVPDAPYLHLMPTVWTDEWIPPRALLIPLPVRQSRDDLDRAFDDLLHLGQSRLNHPLELGKRLGSLYPIIAYALEPFRHRVLHHPADKRVHRDGFMLHPLCAVRAVMVRHPLTIIAINPPDGDRRAHDIFRYIARHALILRRHLALLHVGHQAVRILRETGIYSAVDRVGLEGPAEHRQQVPLPLTSQERIRQVL